MAQQQQQQQIQEQMSRIQNRTIRKKAKIKDKIIPQKVRDLVPDSQSYMDLLAFERKLDATIMRKRLDIQEALKRPIKIKRKLRVFITNQYYPGKQQDNDNDNEDCVPQWELKIEGRILETEPNNRAETTATSSSSSSSAAATATTTTVAGIKAKPKKFSSFFKSLVIELDKDLYGPDNHLVEWHRTAQTAETDGFQVKRHGDQTLKCTILMLLDYQPPQFKLDPRLAKLLSIHTATRPVIIQSLWQYIKVHKLQDNGEKEFINLDKYLQQIFDCERIRFSDIPNKLNMHCMPPDPIVINHMINIEANEPKRMSIYDIDVDTDDPIRDQMKNFLSASQTQSLAEVGQLDAKIHEQIEQINQLRLSREFFMSFSEDPQDFINKWLCSQSNDLKSMLDLNGNPEEERKAQFYHEPWTDEAVCRYFYNRVQQRRAELEQVLGIRN
jgi:SWI/SNF-related matrix-associated actin-dependent regulator of chromatin subfamily D